MVVPTVDVLIVAGLQVPVTPLLEVRGNVGGVLFKHNGPICVNAGVVPAVIVMTIVVVVEHCPVAGVNVYDLVTAVDVLIVAGFQVPIIPFVDVDGKPGAAEFWQSGPMRLNIGAIWLLIVTESIAVVAHCPAPGVKV